MKNFSTASWSTASRSSNKRRPYRLAGALYISSYLDDTREHVEEDTEEGDDYF